MTEADRGAAGAQPQADQDHETKTMTAAEAGTALRAAIARLSRQCAPRTHAVTQAKRALDELDEGLRWLHEALSTMGWTMHAPTHDTGAGPNWTGTPGESIELSVRADPGGEYRQHVAGRWDNSAGIVWARREITLKQLPSRTQTYHTRRTTVAFAVRIHPQHERAWIEASTRGSDHDTAQTTRTLTNVDAELTRWIVLITDAVEGATHRRHEPNTRAVTPADDTDRETP